MKDWDDWDDGPDDWDEPKPSGKDSTKQPSRPTKKGRFTALEDQIIKADWRTTTDEEIAKKIGRTEKAVARRRKMMGLSKKNGRPSRETRREAIFTNPSEYNLSRLSKDDRIEFYKTKFDKNRRYPWLRRMLLEDELEYYEEKYIETIDSMDSITLQEEDLVHNMIMKEIQIIRLNQQVKEALERYLDEDVDERRPPPQYLYQDLEKAEQQYVKYQEKLRLTREQRLKIDKEEKMTIAMMVRNFLDANNRKKAGDMAGHMEYFTNKCREDMDKMDFLLGGN